MNKVFSAGSKLFLLLLLITFYVNSAFSQSEMMVIAHRGASADELENSLSAFKRAFELGADAIEMDIWKTTDDSLVIMHDRTTGRTCNENLVVPESDSKQLREISLNNGEKIPFVYEALELVPDGKKIVIEIKCFKEKGNARNLFPMLSDVLKRTGKLKDAIFISFGHEVLIEAKKHLPDTKCYYLSSKENAEDELIALCLKNNFDGLNVHHKLVTESLREKTSQEGLDLLVWTVDKPDDVNHVMNKVSAITTNKPDKIRGLIIHL